MNELTRDVQADDAKLRILAKLQNLFSNMSVGGFIAMPILVLPIFFIDGLAETIFPVVAMFIIFGLIIGGAVGGWLTDRSAKKLAAAYTPSVLARVMDHLDEYDRNATVSRRYLEEDLGYPHYDRLGDYGDYVEGAFRGVPVRFGEFALEEEYWQRDDDGDETRSFREVFKGLMLITNHSLQLGESLTVSSYCNYAGGIKTGNGDFDKVYSVNSEDEQDVLAALTPSRVEGMVRLAEEMGNRVSLRFLKEGRLLVVVRDMDLFEAGENTSTDQLVASIEAGMEELGHVLDLIEVRELALR